MLAGQQARSPAHRTCAWGCTFQCEPVSSRVLQVDKAAYSSHQCQAYTIYNTVKTDAVVFITLQHLRPHLLSYIL